MELPFWAATWNRFPVLIALIRKREKLAVPVLRMVPASLILAIKAILKALVLSSMVVALVTVSDCLVAPLSMLKRATLEDSEVSVAIPGQMSQLGV